MRWISLLLGALLATLWAGCSDARLYGLGLEDLSPDRLGLTGRVCTDDPRKAEFPVRVVFVVDTALGPLFSEFDLEGARLAALNTVVQLHAGNEDMSFAVIAFGANARQLAPSPGEWFTRNAGDLENAIATLALPQGCIAGICRDYDDALDLAQSVIEGDLADLTAGRRGRTQYVVVTMAAGPPHPIDPKETWQDVTAELTETVTALREEVEDAGALSFSLHALQLAARDDRSPDPDADLQNTQSLLEQMALAGQGAFERFNTPDSISLDRVGLLKLSSLLEAKALVVTNISVIPESGVAEMDSDGDGLSDIAERGIGSDVRNADTDFDGLNDMIELKISMDPTTPDDAPQVCGILGPPPWADRDNDRLNGCEEMLLGTDDSLPDTDGDAIPDQIEVALGLDYLLADGLDDSDVDGAPNGDEVLHHTDPRSGDATSHLADAYRYDLVDLGTLVEPSVTDPRAILGVTVASAGPESTGGLGTLRYQIGDPATLSWQDPQDDGPGDEVPIPVAGTFTLASNHPSGDRWISVDVQLAQLPPQSAEESLLVRLSERHCIDWTVRNVKLVETKPDGVNDVFVYFAQAPLGELSRPGLFRLAHVPVRYHPERGLGRTPSAALVEVKDEEFAPIGD